MNLRPLAGGKWDILLFILFFGSEFGSLNPKNWPKSVEILVLGVPWVGSLCQKGTPKNRLLDTPVRVITFYNIQPKNVNRNIHIPRLHIPTAHLRNRPEVSRLRPEANSADHRRITALSIITRPALLPSPPHIGVSRVTAVQIHPTISCSARAGSIRQTALRNRPPRCGFTQQSKRDRSATWWPGDIHTRPSVPTYLPTYCGAIITVMWI